MPTISDPQRLAMALPARTLPFRMNLQAATLPEFYPMEEIKENLQLNNKDERIRRANYLLQEMLRKRASLNYKPEKVYGDALYKALLRQLRRWVRNLLDPVLLNAKPNSDNVQELIEAIL